MLCGGGAAASQENTDCLTCHEDKSLTGTRRGRTISIFVDEKKFAGSVHADVPCVACHADLAGKELPHEEDLAPAVCGALPRHGAALHAGRCTERLPDAAIRWRRVAPIATEPMLSRKSRSPFSGVAAEGSVPLRQMPQEGRRSRQRAIHQDHILENYSESIHGEGLLRKGLIVARNCASCHTAHSILPHTDPASSSIARRNIAATCTKCHAQIETVHRKVIKGELWEKEAHMLPACVDCHQPHKVRKVFYDQGMADRDCLRCHARTDLVSAKDGRSLTSHRNILRAPATQRLPAASAMPA